MLKLPWKSALELESSAPAFSKAKCLSIRILSQVGCLIQPGVVLAILDLGLHDEDVEVRTHAVISMPVIVLLTGLDILTHMFNRLE